MTRDPHRAEGEQLENTEPSSALGSPLSPSHRCEAGPAVYSEPGSLSAVRASGSRFSDLPWVPRTGRSLGIRAQRLPPRVHTLPRLTASVLVLPAGAVQDPVAPVRGADAGSRRAALYPGHGAFVLHLRVTGGRPSQPETARKPHAHSASSGVLSQGPK